MSSERPDVPLARAKLSPVLCLAVAAVFAGCVSSSVARLDGDQRARVPPSEVTVYLEEDDIPAPYEKQAVIDLSGAHGWTDTADLYEEAREEAAEIGANGVLVEKVEEAGVLERVAEAVFGIPADNDARMVALYVRTPEEPVRRLSRQ